VTSRLGTVRARSVDGANQCGSIAPLSDDVFATWPGELLSLLDAIETVEALDVMCLVARDHAAALPFDEIERRTSLAYGDVMHALAHLRRTGLVVDADDGNVRLASLDPPLNAARLALLRLYDQDKSLMVRAMAERSIERLRTSAAQLLGRR
jgi:DNA-binding transcriptional ArsR family regulator